MKEKDLLISVALAYALELAKNRSSLASMECKMLLRIASFWLELISLGPHPFV
jgi:hypothetical protein